MEHNRETRIDEEDIYSTRLRPDTLLQGGKYRIVRYLSRGGFGCTYEAVNTTMRNRRVAIKELFVRDFCTRDPHTGSVTVLTQTKQPLFDKLRTKFLDEAEAIMNLNHPGIVRVTDAFEENGTAYYVMDYIDGESLKQKLDNAGAIQEAVAVHYIRQVAESLRYVHDKKLLHLDIKPGNVMVDGDDRAILIDFGVSKQYDEASGENTSSVMGHSPGYAPPEQSNNSIGKFLPATDIYALGTTLYHLLSGTVPPPSGELASGEKLPELPAKVSATTRRAVLSAMTINKDSRPQSVADFLALLDGKKTGGGRSGGSQSPKSDKPFPWPLVALAVMILGVAAVVLIKPKPHSGGEVIPADTIALAVDSVASSDAPSERTTEKLIQDALAKQNEKSDEMAKLKAENERLREAHRQDSLAAVKKAEKERKEKERLAQAAREAEAARKAEEAKKATAQQVVATEKTYQVGDYYDRNGIRGVVFEVSDGGRHGKVLSMDRGETCWCTTSQYDKNITTGASSDWNGKSNTDKILSRSDRDEYRAFVWCRNKGSNWYLPSKEELLTMYRNKEKINATLSKHGGTTLNGWYWSSTEYSGWTAWRVNMNNGSTHGSTKSPASNYVRAAVAF